ncbi:diphosphomevalonate decarboxylase isoform X1 [Neodiprion fabricii]|uniref:diphosphomevalonate decarboxylase isoform X1 n=1 Tax=Neodiprion fabricii TaxID=2872261 RepID=UPI001ED93AF0|nr:diphosphomevalonate decarboxylase isoform X1 [Neodiprion fabricii]
MNVVTCIAPVNIAVIKYWGKRDEDLILPINDSLSATLHTDHLCAKTTVMTSADFKEDRIWLNGSEESIDNKRLQNCLKEIRKRAKLGSDVGSWKVHICSENNFPTAAGLASSAAGYACLVAALAGLYNVEGDISAAARSGSGSACRSVFGGFVRWYSGSKPDGSDSIAKQIAAPEHWPQMRILVLVVNDASKKVSSAIGMKRSVATSELLKYRAEHSVPRRVEEMTKAILDRDFTKFAELTMKDSNQFHATCLDTFPPCVYMNDTSHAIVELIHAYNAAAGETKAAYTFDAGPNATLYLLEKDVPEVISILNHYFPTISLGDIGVEYLKGIPVQPAAVSEDLLRRINAERQSPGKLKYIIHTCARDVELIDKYGVITSLFGACIHKRDTRPLQEIVGEIIGHFVAYEEELGKRGTIFFGGTEPGMLDVLMWPWVERAKALPLAFDQPLNFDKEKFPHLMKWINGMKGQKFVQKNFGPFEAFAKVIKAQDDVDYDSI